MRSFVHVVHAKTTRTRHVSRRIKEAKIKPTARKTKGVALMKIPYADAIEVATEDVARVVRGV